jgi:p-aminobenzoyl-glutamate transporter AbgT
MAYFDTELKSNLAFAIVGIAVGYASFLTNSNIGAFILMIVIGAAVAFILKRKLKITESYKWFFSNGLIIYILLWLITWVIFYNVGLR